jgi:ubiquinone/menaquinone biosynthesis C-methylase UbiE
MPGFMAAHNPYFDLPFVYASIVAPFLAGSHLDYGCGDGRFSLVFRRLPGVSSVFGYDISEQRIACANSCLKKNGITFFSPSSFDRYTQEPFDSVSLNFVFHETGHDVLNDIFRLLKNGGKAVVLDYDLKHRSEEEFRAIFCTGPETLEVQRIGISAAFLSHTEYGLEECIASAESAGLKTLASRTLYDKYFVWIGQKVVT